jgi:hypothetical protein
MFGAGGAALNAQASLQPRNVAAGHAARRGLDLITREANVAKLVVVQSPQYFDRFPTPQNPDDIIHHGGTTPDPATQEAKPESV